jgi:xanthine dehydrogenase YagR molybdenum-binding subunit
LLEQSETDPVMARFLHRNYSVPTNADIPELDVIFAGEFDSEASLLGSKGVWRADRCFRGARNSQRGLSRHWKAHS